MFPRAPTEMLKWKWWTVGSWCMVYSRRQGKKRQRECVMSVIQVANGWWLMRWNEQCSHKMSYANASDENAFLWYVWCVVTRASVFVSAFDIKLWHFTKFFLCDANDTNPTQPNHPAAVSWKWNFYFIILFLFLSFFFILRTYLLCFFSSSSSFWYAVYSWNMKQLCSIKW